MKILILGVSGMLGHRLFLELGKQHEVWGTVRDEAYSYSVASLFATKDRIIPMVHCGNWNTVSCVLHDMIRPDVVINCTAAIPQRNPDIHDMLNANAQFPHFLAKHCSLINARLIHFSTDAVFSGSRGNYTEDDIPDGSDTYALTKRLGEISDQEHVLTLRCCPIGRELNGAHSLVEWFLAQTGKIQGYIRACFTPLSTFEIARLLNEYVLKNQGLHGLFHVGSNTIDKYSFLVALAKRYQKIDVEIDFDSSKQLDRSLDSRVFNRITGYKHPSWGQMLDEMAANNALYEGVHAHQ